MPAEIVDRNEASFTIQITVPYPMFGVQPPEPAAPARKNALFSSPGALGDPLSASKV
jgi:hypothetical protein